MLAGEKAGQGPAFPVSPPAAPVVPSPIAAASPASVFPPRASFGRRVGAYLIDRLAVFLIVALLIAAAAWLSSPGTDAGSGGAASQIQAHLDDGSAVRAEAPMVIAFGPLLLLLSILAPQLGFPLILLFFLRSPINPETYKAEAALLTGVMLVGLLLTLLYKPVLECLWNGRTLGKRLMGIRVAAPDGGKAGAGRIFVRELVGDFLLGGMTGGITTIVSIFTASIGREHKAFRTISPPASSLRTGKPAESHVRPEGEAPMDTQLKKGVLELAILYQLREGEEYGYEIMKRIREEFPDVYEGSVYAILRRLAAEGVAAVSRRPSGMGPRANITA